MRPSRCSPAAFPRSTAPSAWRSPRPSSARRCGDWPARGLDAYVARHYPAYWLKVDLPHKLAHARFVRDARRRARGWRPTSASMSTRGVTELTVFAPDHPWLLSIIAGACARRRRQHRRRPDLHHDRRARARHHRGLARVRARRGRGTPRRAYRRGDREGGARSIRLPEVVPSARRRKGGSRLSPSSPR